MSFRLRVLLFVVAVALTATGATAWLTLTQASRQVNDSAAMDLAQLELVGAKLTEYGARHGTWEGVAGLVLDLHAQTGQRLHLVAESGVVLVDTDTENGVASRPLGRATTFIDPRPQLSLPSGLPDASAVTTRAIIDYRDEVRRAACLSRLGVAVTVAPDLLGVPHYAVADVTPADLVAGCEPAGATAEELATISARIGRCTDLGGTDPSQSADPSQPADPSPPADLGRASGPTVGQPATPPPRSTPDPLAGETLDTCLSRAFTEQISDIAPVPAQLFLGVRGDSGIRLSAGPLLAAATGVAAVVVLGTVLLSHRVLRPIGTLTTAAHRLGRGELDGHVPVRGSDELAELGLSFNRMADSLRRGEERQRRMVADVAHELRTPLANLRGYLEALADGVVAPSPALFASLHEEAVLQQRIVDDLQDLALAESGRLAYHRVTVDLAELLATCHTAHRANAATAGVTLEVRATGPGPLVNADPDRLRQVVGNLVTNALRATPADGTVSLHAETAGGDAVIRVVDSGTGIDPAVLPYVFDRFWRADEARGRRTGGGGLGLAIARQIVTDHGGTIEAASRPGAGSTFTITLPTSAPAGT
nr:HAMP domain-containing sensor histidine kinase [Micromonospora sp. DSM 115978]